MPQIFPFQLKLDVKEHEECHFRLAIVVSSNPINFIDAHSLDLTSTRNNAHSQSLMDYCSQLWQVENGIHSRLV